MWRTGEAQGRVANDAGALVGEVEEGGGALVVRHDGQGAQQHHCMCRHSPAAVLAQQRKDRAQVAACHSTATSLLGTSHNLPCGAHLLQLLCPGKTCTGGSSASKCCLVAPVIEAQCP